jgi:pentatricopeptide repeat protein
MEIHEEIKRRGFMSNVPVARARMDMHEKCGRLVKAREVFDEILERNVISLTVMIAGYAR